MDVSVLPAVNACLNTLAAVLLLFGWRAILKRRIEVHRRFMLSAFGCSILFLTSYLYYHSIAGSTPFTGQGLARTVYFTVLLSHTVLAAVVPFLAVVTLVRAFRERFDQHARIARITLPIWLYVSVTGVVVYWMLYQMEWPAA